MLVGQSQPLFRAPNKLGLVIKRSPPSGPCQCCQNAWDTWRGDLSKWEAPPPPGGGSCRVKVASVPTTPQKEFLARSHASRALYPFAVETVQKDLALGVPSRVKVELEVVEMAPGSAQKDLLGTLRVLSLSVNTGLRTGQDGGVLWW